MRTKRNKLTRLNRRKMTHKMRSKSRITRKRQTRRRYKKGGQFKTPNSKIDMSRIPLYNGDPGLDTPEYETPTMRGTSTPEMYPGDPGLDTPTPIKKDSPSVIVQDPSVRKLFED